MDAHLFLGEHDRRPIAADQPPVVHDLAAARYRRRHTDVLIEISTERLQRLAVRVDDHEFVQSIRDRAQVNVAADVQ